MHDIRPTDEATTNSAAENVQMEMEISSSQITKPPYSFQAPVQLPNEQAGQNFDTLPQ